MKRMAIAAIATLALAGSALAADDIMAPRYGNTTIATNSKGQQVKTYYNADHTFTVLQGGNTMAGKWQITNGNLCRTYDAMPDKPPACSPAGEMHKVGETWMVGSGPGAVTLTIVKGRS